MNLDLSYKLYPNDYLQQVLYYNTVSVNSKKQRTRAWLFVIFIIVISNALLLYVFREKIEIGHYLGAIPMSILGIFLFPYFYRTLQKKQLLKFVEETYKNNFGKESNLSFSNENIEIHNSTGESTIKYATIEKIIEISGHFFLVLKAGTYIIIPKSEMSDIGIVKNTLHTIAAENKILYSSELDWKWK